MKLIRISGPSCFLHFVFTTSGNSPPPLLLTPDSSRSDVLVRSDVMCRAGSEQRDIEPATGYWSNEVTHPAGHAGLFGTHEGGQTHESLSFICVFFFWCSDENFLKRGNASLMHELNCLTVALGAAGQLHWGAAGSSRVSGRAQVQLLALISVSLLSAPCSPSGF